MFIVLVGGYKITNELAEALRTLLLDEISGWCNSS